MLCFSSLVLRLLNLFSLLDVLEQSFDVERLSVPPIDATTVSLTEAADVSRSARMSEPTDILTYHYWASSALIPEAAVSFPHQLVYLS